MTTSPPLPSAAGWFIVIDGIDGAGKSTQAKRFCELFNHCGFSAIQSFEPTDGPWGRKIRESAVSGRMSLEDELHAFLADRHEHLETLIQPALANNQVVIVDRYFYSTVAYQGLRGIDTVDLLDRMRAEFRIPDLTLFFDLTVSLALERISLHRGDIPNEFEQEDALSRIRETFQMMSGVCDEVRTIDCVGDVDTVRSNVASAIGEYLRSRPDVLAFDNQAKTRLLKALDGIVESRH
ncbi:Thymidylate kinase [Novipirellula aureliae]|uniref:Thymidylate kinase n=1 Tax=Novipirellula aureliae TaxID=2527966 RepID=A0A5C6DVE3_9BACT|nr:dTMP kinase [Novipirellula aureliae]TWU38769.1 Thymidylate kinase [Novipirellula aureliae]